MIAVSRPQSQQCDPVANNPISVSAMRSQNALQSQIIRSEIGDDLNSNYG